MKPARVLVQLKVLTTNGHCVAVIVRSRYEFKKWRIDTTSASLGLVPRQHTTGGKPALLGISKRRYVPAYTVDSWCALGRARARTNPILGWPIQRVTPLANGVRID